jgi:membrane protease YdiL (CAAX protease family)
MTRALMVLGLVTEGVAWWVVAARRRSVWAVMTPVLVGLGALTLVVDPPSLASEVGLGLAAVAGLGAGVILYLATLAFVVVATRWWKVFERQSVAMYGRRGSLSVGAAVALSAVLMVPGEELFWRGLVQGELERSLGGLLGPVLAWGAFVLANLPSANLAIIAAAAVGGAVWVALAAWSGGILASLVCHACWAALMLSLPPVRPMPEEGS